ncbi:hypothetical protein [Methanosarcina horonobensis]|nr:hypothetical protein [Methanosarcina horonobensis]
MIIGMVSIKPIEVKRTRTRITGVKTIKVKVSMFKVNNAKTNIKKISDIALKFKVMPDI